MDSSVTGQIVVDTAIVCVVTEYDSAGQFVTVDAQCIIVDTEYVYTVDVE